MSTHGTGFTQAFRTLTILPAPGKDAAKASSQLFFYPAVGLVIGAIGSLIPWIYLRFCNKNVILGIVLGVLWTCWMTFVTRAFHLDGLGDTADGFGGGWTKERRLEIMKDSRSGSFGVAAICLCLLLKSACAASAVISGSLPVLIWSAVSARFCVVCMCSFCSYAKNIGLSYDLVSGAGAGHAVVALMQTAAFGAGLYFLPLLTGTARIGILSLAVPFAASLCAMLVLSLVSRRKIGGITGDVLGACCEICEVAALLAAVFIPSVM